MGNKLHKELTGDELHNPKGFDEAPNETALVKNFNGDLEFRALSELGETGPVGPQGPDASAVDKVVVCQKAPGPGQFSDPIVAMASIVGSSTSNPFVLKVGPGIYSLSAPLVVKEGVTVKPDGHSTVILEPANPNNDIIQMPNINSRIQGMTLRNATGPSAAAVRITNTPTPPVLDFITIQNCTEEIVVESSSAITQAVLRNIRLISGATTKKLLRITSAGFASIVRVYSGILTDDNGSAFEDAVLLEGVGARLDANIGLIRSTVGVGNGIRVRDGGELVSQAGSEVEGFDKNMFVEAGGAAPTIRTTTVMLRNGVTADLDIQHSGAIGSMLLKANLAKVFAHDDAPVKLTISDPNNASPIGVFLRGEILQANKFSQKINASKLLRSTSTMGLLSGGEITLAGGLNVAVAAGDGFLIDSVDGFVKEIEWEPDVLTIPANTSRYVYINSNGIVSQSASFPDTIQNIILGRVSTLTSAVLFIQHVPIELSQFGNRSAAFSREAFGPVYASGSIVSENVTTARALDITPGVWWYSVIRFVPMGGIAVPFTQFYRQAVSGYNFVTGVIQVTNSQYDDGSGALVSLGAGKFAKHSLYTTGDGVDEKYILGTAQAQYDTLVEAEAANIPTPPNALDDAVSLIATIIVEQGNPVLRVYDERPVIGFKASGISASAVHANLLGLLEDDHPQYFLANGGRPMSGNMDMGGNNIGNVGTVDGVDVSNHAARHHAGGADPLGTGTPSFITDSVNSVGVGPGYSLQDHAHAHGSRGGGTQHAEATTLLAGFLSAADKVRVNSIESLADGRIALQKGAPSGIAPLDAGSLIPAIYLPSFVDDVLEYANVAAFPVTGETGKIYVALDTNKTYRWSGSVYVEISASPGTTDALVEGVVNLYYTLARFNSAFAGKTTADLAELTNLYFTNARARAALSALTPLAYDNETGQFSIPAAAAPSTNGYMSGADKQKLDRLATSFLQYNNNAQYVRTGTTFTDTVLDTDLSSFANGLMTKLSTTEFRTDFAGRVRIHYSLNGAAAGNNRGFKAQMVKNGTLIPNTLRHSASSSAISQAQIGHTQIVECAVNDVFKLQTASEDANTVTFGAGETSVLIDVYSLGLT